MMMSRRYLVFSPLLSIFLCNPVVAQLTKTVYSEEVPTIEKLKKAQSLEEVFQIASEWNVIYRNQAGATGVDYQTDYDKIVEGVSDEIKSKIKEETTKTILKKVAPKLLELLLKASKYIEAIAPLFVAIEIFLTPSDTASDAYEIQQSDVRVQKAVRNAINRFVPSPNWYDDLKQQISLPVPGPTLRKN